MTQSVKVLELPDLAITLMQHGFDHFSVTYGQQYNAHLTYAEAVTELGRSIMHSLACDGKLDNRTTGEAHKDDVYWPEIAKELSKSD